MNTIKTTQAMPYRSPCVVLVRTILLCLLFMLSACQQHASVNQQSTQQYQPAASQKQQQLTIPLAPLEQWQVYPFAGNTHYSITEEDDEQVIKAHSIKSASMIYQKRNIDLSETPFLQWSWRVENIFPSIKEKTRQGDDFAARLYIAVKGKTGSIYPRTLTYVWATNAKINAYWQSPYSSQAILVAANSGEKETGKWITHKRNLKEDLQYHFKEEFQNIEGIAIMTDSDNFQSEATAYYKNILFSKD